MVTSGSHGSHLAQPRWHIELAEVIVSESYELPSGGDGTGVGAPCSDGDDWTNVSGRNIALPKAVLAKADQCTVGLQRAGVHTSRCHRNDWAKVGGHVALSELVVSKAYHCPTGLENTGVFGARSNRDHRAKIRWDLALAKVIMPEAHELLVPRHHAGVMTSSSHHGTLLPAHRKKRQDTVTSHRFDHFGVTWALLI